jgi:CRISPR-associated endonuclease/helicase Cas3
LTSYGKGKELIAELCSKRCEQDAEYRAELLKTASDYTVSLYQYQKKRLEESHGLYSICGGCALALAEDFYDEALGVTKEPGSMSFLEG